MTDLSFAWKGAKMHSEFCPGDIVLVEVFFTNHSGFKLRPAIVVSSLQYNIHRSDIVVMPITGQKGSTSQNGAHFGDIVLGKSEGTGLNGPIIVKPVPLTIQKGRIGKKMGSCHKADLSYVLEHLTGNILAQDPQKFRRGALH